MVELLLLVLLPQLCGGFGCVGTWPCACALSFPEMCHPNPCCQPPRLPVCLACVACIATQLSPQWCARGAKPRQACAPLCKRVQPTSCTMPCLSTLPDTGCGAGNISKVRRVVSSHPWSCSPNCIAISSLLATELDHRLFTFTAPSFTCWAVSS